MDYNPLNSCNLVDSNIFAATVNFIMTDAFGGTWRSSNRMMLDLREWITRKLSIVPSRPSPKESEIFLSYASSKIGYCARLAYKLVNSPSSLIPSRSL